MFRVGNGIDVHQFTKNKPLIVGGIKIDYPLGLEGHSDADVLVHAIIDALLGASSNGDIGTHFPDNDKTYKDISSIILLKKTLEIIAPYKIINIDTTILLQKPKISPYFTQIKNNLLEHLNISENQLNIKATTTEKLGFLGREEGIAVLATALLSL
jgi:2-C-methyl-D-erythritol 2,4-cyclodiphosphate synthase